MWIETAQACRRRADSFLAEAHQILGIQESSKSRVVNLDQTRARLDVLTLKQDGLFKEAIVCMENGLFRAAHVMAWAGFMDFLEERLSTDGLVRVKLARTAWAKFGSIEELRESIPESQLIEVAREIGLLSKSETKTLQGMLSKRNENAHPSGYAPELNDTLGYVSELLNRIQGLHARSL